MTKISVLLPIYKTKPEYLRQAIESILNQTYTDFEFLIADDCPTDNREEIVTSYKDARIIYFQNKQNLGISDTRNILIEKAKGEYLAVMDHDDISLPTRLEKECNYLDTHPNIGVVGTWYKKFPNEKIKEKYILNGQIKQDLMSNCSVLHPSAMIRKKILVDNNIRYEKEFSPAEDYALWCRLINKTQFANIPEILHLYRTHGENTSQLQKDKMKIAREKIHDFVTKDNPQLKKITDYTYKTSILGLPIKRKVNGLNYKNNILGIRYNNSAKILTFDATNLPIYIICYNRLSYLQMIIEHLEKYGYTNIHIIDNCSSYHPLLEYLQTTPYKVHHMDKNYGHMVFFKADEFKAVRENEYYVLTDPDVIPVDECPEDYLSLFYDILQQYPRFYKVGFSLKTDDIKGNSVAAETLRKWESLFYKHKLNHFHPFLYDSYIDTTFALYRPKKDIKKYDFYKAIRTGYPYEARHMPWYKDLSTPTKEDLFYSKTDCGSGNWNDAEGIKRVQDCLNSKMVDHWYENIFSIKQSRQRNIIRILGIKFTINKKTSNVA